MPAPTTLRIAIGDYPHTLPLKRGEITSPWLILDFQEVKPMHKAFKPMVREHAYDASELALVTALQAKIYNKGLKLLPATMLARFQHGTVLHNVEKGKLTPADLAGKRIGVRSYTQTTGVWIRGILQNDYGVDLSGVQWVTFEDGHLAEFPDPPSVIRAGTGQDITQMLIDGEIDAAIYGAAMPKDARLQSVIPVRTRPAASGGPSTAWCPSTIWWWCRTNWRRLSRRRWPSSIACCKRANRRPACRQWADPTWRPSARMATDRRSSCLFLMRRSRGCWRAP